MTRSDFIAYLLVSGWVGSTSSGNNYEIYTSTYPALKARRISIGVSQFDFDVMVILHDCMECLSPVKPFRYGPSVLKQIYEEYANG